MIANLYDTELRNAVLADLMGFTDGEVVGQVIPRAFIAAVIGSE